MGNQKNYKLQNLRICVVGLGYVGLPLAVTLSKHFPVKGFDVNQKRVAELKNGIDSTLEITKNDLKQLKKISFAENEDEIRDCNCFIVTVPTPIDRHKQPDLTPLLSATKTIGSVLKINDVVIFESTVYPGATEEECIPILENCSKLTLNKDFIVGYSPERVNLGDKVHTISKIRKITSGSSPFAANFIDSIYKKIISSGTHKTKTIRIAEAAKVIENTQRDLNIALINEVAIIFNRLGIDTASVLEAAGTKWNFLPFKPGLVGGHCIGVDPYYLTHKGQAIGYHPEIILAGRRLNDGMGSYISSQLIKAMGRSGIKILNSKVLILGITFKENCPDIRNSRIPDIVAELTESGCCVDVMDPHANSSDVKREYSFELIEQPKSGVYDAIIIAVAHEYFISMGSKKIHAYGKSNHILYDIKSIFQEDQSTLRL